METLEFACGQPSCTFVGLTLNELGEHKLDKHAWLNIQPATSIKPKLKRVRRKRMNVETFARFCNSASIALTTIYDSFDPSHQEVVFMLERLYVTAKHLQRTTTRRTS